MSLGCGKIVTTYAFPFATVGTVNLTAIPAASAAFCTLFHSSVEMLLASYACSTAGPPAAQLPTFVPQLFVFRAHTMPLLVPDEEIEGVAPGNGNPVGDCGTVEVLNSPVVAFSA